MPIRERVQRLWRLVVGWWRPSENGSLSSAVAPIAPTGSPQPGSPARQRSRTARGKPTEDGEPIIAGAVTVRMWVVGGRLLLATSPVEAERALVTLLPELDADAQRTAGRLLDALRTGHARAA